jgi:hypothetical protein
MLATDTQEYDIVDHIHHIVLAGIGKCPAIAAPSTTWTKSKIDNNATIGTITVINRDDGSSVKRLTMTKGSCVVAQGNFDDGDIEPDAVLVTCADHIKTITVHKKGHIMRTPHNWAKDPLNMDDATYPTIGTLTYDNGSTKEHDFKSRHSFGLWSRQWPSTGMIDQDQVPCATIHMVCPDTPYAAYIQCIRFFVLFFCFCHGLPMDFTPSCLRLDNNSLMKTLYDQPLNSHGRGSIMSCINTMRTTETILYHTNAHDTPNIRHKKSPASCAMSTHHAGPNGTNRIYALVFLSVFLGASLAESNPALVKKMRTRSVGCAPWLNQYSIRSLFNTTRLGSSLASKGLYVPNFSFPLLRGKRESAAIIQ